MLDERGERAGVGVAVLHVTPQTATTTVAEEVDLEAHRWVAGTVWVYSITPPRWDGSRASYIAATVRYAAAKQRGEEELEPATLPFLDLAERHPGLTPAIGAVYAEAARVCLDRHHESPAQLVITFVGDENGVTAKWLVTDANLRAAYANETDTTELGAYCLALAAVERVADLVAIHRAETGTGADYYVAPTGSSIEDLETAYRLEVSGVDRGDHGDVRVRLRQKLRQAEEGESNLPALAAVVGFASRIVAIAKASP